MLNKYKLQYFYYSIVVVGYILQVFVPFMKPGVLATLLMLLIIIQTGNSELKFQKDNNRGISQFLKEITLIDAVVTVYFVYNILSVIWLTFYGLPVSVFSGEFVSSVLPVVFYFAAVSRDDSRTDFYKGFTIAMIILGIVSLVLYLWAPQFYCDYLYKMSYISKADAQTARVRMEAVTGSTSMSFLSIAGMIVASYGIIEAVKKDSTDKSKKRSIAFSVVFFVFSLILVFLSNSRAGMVTAILVIFYLNIVLVFSVKLINKKFFYIEVCVAIAGIIAVCIAMPAMAGKIFARLVSLPGAVGQRSEQWVAAMNNMHGAWLGNGLGANGHRALYISEDVHVVADGGLVKLFCEEGCIGFGLFIYVLISVIVKGIKKIDRCFAEIAVIGTVLLMSIGANVIAFQLCTPVFWYAIGYISKQMRDREDLLAYSIKDRTVEERE